LNIYCRFIGGRLPLFVGGDLSFRMTRIVRGHLQKCGQCHAVYQSYRRSYVALHRIGDAHEPEAVAEEFWPELRQRLRGDRRPLRRIKTMSGSLFARRVAVAAGVLFAFGTGFLIGDPTIFPTGSGVRPGGGEAAASRPQPLALPSEFGQHVNDVTPRNVDSYYLRETRIVPPKKSLAEDPRFLGVPIRAAGGEDDFR
jgi:hypothetical protein